MVKKYFDKKLIKKIFGKAGSLNIPKLKKQLECLESIFLHSINKNSPKLVAKNVKKPSLIEENPKPLNKIFLRFAVLF
jgi:hypothetical protein